MKARARIGRLAAFVIAALLAGGCAAPQLRPESAPGPEPTRDVLAVHRRTQGDSPALRAVLDELVERTRAFG